MKLIFQFALMSLLFISLFSCNQKEKTIKNYKVEQYKKFISEMNSRGLNTGNILVYENGEVIFESANGLRTINPTDSLNLDAQFRIASVSKQFTGVAIMKLKQAGKLDYDQKVNSILTDFPYHDITIKHLLNHTSGLGDDEELIDEHFVSHDSTKNIIGNDVILKVLYKVKPELDFQPGEDWQYSNMGYTVLASIVEKVSKQHFRDFLKEQIFDPLEMNNTSLYKYQEAKDPNMPNRVFGYNKAINQKDLILVDYHLINDVRGSGGIYSTLRDLYKWNMALINYKVLPKEYIDEAWSWGKLNNGKKIRYGFGWKFPKDQTAPKTVFHAGGWAGFGTYLYNEIDTKSGYIVLTNDNWEAFESITNAIDSIRVGAPYNLQKKSMGREMLKHRFSENLNAAINFYKKNKTNSNLYSTNVYEIQNAGYELMNNNYLEDALQIFELNIEEYPNLPNTYAAYADALSIKGDTLKALENYKASLRIDSSFNYSKNRIGALEKNSIEKVAHVNNSDFLKTDVKKKINKVHGSIPIPELLDFVQEIKKSDWNPDTLRLKKVDYYNYLKEKTLFNEYPFYKIKYEDTEIKWTNEYEPELLKEQSNNSENQVDIELFKSVKSIWGYFYRGKKIGNSISDGVIEQWEFNNEEDAEKALNQIKPAGHLVYFNTMPYHYRIKNYLITFRTRAMAYSYEQGKVFKQFIKTAPNKGYK